MTLSRCRGQQRMEQTGWIGGSREKKGCGLCGCVRLKPGSESQSVHFKNQDVLIYTHLPQTARCWGSISLPKPKVLNKRDGPIQECTKYEESAAERDGNTREKRGWWGGRGHRESTWWSLYFTPMFVIIVLFFNISYVCIFLPTEERVNKLREKAKWVHECEGNREKSPIGAFSPVFFVTIQRKFTILQWVKAAQLVIVRAAVGEIMIVW